MTTAIFALIFFVMIIVGVGVYKHRENLAFNPDTSECIGWSLGSLIIAGIETFVGYGAGFFIQFFANMFGVLIIHYASSVLMWAISKFREVQQRYFSRCPSCDSREVLHDRKLEIFDVMLNNGANARAHAISDSFECCECDMQWTGFQGERARAHAVKKLNKQYK